MKPNPFGRLWVRLFLATVAPVALALISVGLLANYVAVGQFDSFFQQSVQQRDARLLESFQREYLDRRSWSTAGDIALHDATLSGERLVVADASGLIVADSAGQSVGAQAGRTWRRAMPILAGGQQVGTLYINPTLAGRADSVQERTFLDGVNRSLLLGLVLAAVVSLLISFVVARALAQQMVSLINVARRIGRGNLSLRARTVSGELGELATAINAMAADLQLSLQLRQQMVADIAHELRTPLQNIGGYLEALKDGVASADEHTLGILSSETNVLRQMVDDLQELSLAESGALTIELAPVQVEEQVRAVVGSMLMRADEHGIRLTSYMAPGLPRVMADERRLRQVLANLVSNCLEIHLGWRACLGYGPLDDAGSGDYSR